MKNPNLLGQVSLSILTGALLFFHVSVSSGSTLILESVSGEANGEDTRSHGIVVDSMTSNGFTSIPKTVGQLLPSEPLSEPDLEKLNEVKQLYRKAEQDWYESRLKDAGEKFNTVIQNLSALPVLLSENEEARNLLYSALSTSMMVHDHRKEFDLRNQRALQILRDFPNRPVDSSVLGPKAPRVYRKGIKTVPKRVNVAIKIDIDDADIFINGRNSGTGSTTQSLLPGDYKIYAKKGNTRSVMHSVRVESEKPSSVEIRFIVESTLHLGKNFLWLQFSNEDDQRSQEKTLAKAIATWFNFDQFVLLGTYNRWKEKGIIGTLYNTKTGALIRTAYLSSKTAATKETALKAMGVFLSNGKKSPNLITSFDPYGADKPLPPPKKSSISPWIWVGVGVAAIAVVAILASGGSDDKCNCTPPLKCINGKCVNSPPLINDPNRSFNSQSLLWLGGGAAIIGAAVYRWP